MKVGDKIVFTLRGHLAVATIGSKSNHWLYTAAGKGICHEAIAKPYTAANMLAAMQERENYNQEYTLTLFERYANDFPGEYHRDEIHEGTNAQLGITGRQYAFTKQIA